MLCLGAFLTLKVNKLQKVKKLRIINNYLKLDNARQSTL